MTESRFSHRALLSALDHAQDIIASRPGPASDVVVLLPFAQLLPIARRAWSHGARGGFWPRFETSHSWAQRLAPFVPQGLDIAMQPGRDLLVARDLLRAARLPAAPLARALVQAAWELQRCAAAVPAAERAAWVERQRALLPLAPDAPYVYEAALARLALEWVARSRCKTDCLWDEMQSGRVRHLVVLRGLQPDPLADAWLARWPARCEVIDLLAPVAMGGSPSATPPTLSQIRLHAAQDAEDEAQRAAACVLAHLAAGRCPVGMATTDRVLSRRVQALLAERGVQVSDETGWRLSTTRAAATVRLALDAWAPDPSTDRIVDWLQHLSRQDAPVVAPAAVAALESLARRHGLSRWRDVVHRASAAGVAAGVAPLVEQVQGWLASGGPRRPLAAWLRALRDLLQRTGLWDSLLADDAGARVIDALRMSEHDDAALAVEWEGLSEASRAVSWHTLSEWADAVLEDASFRPRSNAVVESPEVVLLPLAQFAGRSLAAVVLPGCDEAHLPVAPPTDGPWTATQREALGLPGAADLQRIQARAWAEAIDAPVLDVLWRNHDAQGNPVPVSAWVDRLALAGAAQAADPRVPRALSATPTDGALAHAPERVPTRLSASAYADLRACPYRFFGLRLLGLRQDDEIDAEVDKRDFGAWVHAALHAFHQRVLQAASAPEPHIERQWLDEAAQQARLSLGLPEDEFLPYLAGWEQLRDAYLEWWHRTRAQGVAFVAGEVDHEVTLARRQDTVVLHGRIDRIDRIEGEGQLRLIDYKTEPRDRTRARVRQPFEDTQMAFYAALLAGAAEPDGSAQAPNTAHIAGVQGGYLQLSEREGAQWIEQPHLHAARDALRAAVVRELDAIAAGAALPALGSGEACTWCQARGLCRKEHWA